MKKIINIIIYVLCILAFLLVLYKNPYLISSYKEVNIKSDKSFKENFSNKRFVCIDLSDSTMTRFKEGNTDSVIYVSNYSNKHFLSLLTKGTSTSSKVCGIIKNNNSTIKDISKVINEENKIKLSNKYFTNYNLKKEKMPYQILLIGMLVCIILFILGIIANIISLIRKEF